MPRNVVRWVFDRELYGRRSDREDRRNWAAIRIQRAYRAFESRYYRDYAGRRYPIEWQDNIRDIYDGYY